MVFIRLSIFDPDRCYSVIMARDSGKKGANKKGAQKEGSSSTKKNNKRKATEAAADDDDDDNNDDDNDISATATPQRNNSSTVRIYKPLYMCDFLNISLSHVYNYCVSIYYITESQS